MEEPFKDKLPHLFTLHVHPDNTFTVKLDHKVINEGNLLDDFTPPVNPAHEIDDPEDKKPSDWDEREKIPDPEARKPDDWDEDAPAMIPDASATKPDSWLEDEPEMIPDPNAEKPDDWSVLLPQVCVTTLIQNCIKKHLNPFESSHKSSYTVSYVIIQIKTIYERYTKNLLKRC